MARADPPSGAGGSTRVRIGHGEPAVEQSLRRVGGVCVMHAAMEGVSFVVPVRNGARFIGGVLEAIAAQADGRRFEMIVVDDGSVDGTAVILERCMARMPLRVIRSGLQGGGSRAELERGNGQVSSGAAAALN